jgi:hypothetical protein
VIQVVDSEVRERTSVGKSLDDARHALKQEPVKRVIVNKKV